jgi:hypothetical protein
VLNPNLRLADLYPDFDLTGKDLLSKDPAVQR